MAGNENSGGFRPTAPQNSPMNVNALGGNGQSGQAKMDYTGMPYGQNQAINQQQSAAPLAGSTPAPVKQEPVTNIFAATQRPDEPVTHGSDMGAGGDTSVLNLPAMNPNTVTDSTANMIRAIYLQDPSNEDLRLIVKSLDEAGR